MNTGIETDMEGMASKEVNTQNHQNTYWDTDMTNWNLSSKVGFEPQMAPNTNEHSEMENAIHRYIQSQMDFCHPSGVRSQFPGRTRSRTLGNVLGYRYGQLGSFVYI
jgi:hypothetical protein